MTDNEFIRPGTHSLEGAEFGSAVRATRAVLTVVADIVLSGTVAKISDGVPEWRRVLVRDSRLLLSRREAGLMTRLYESIHELYPTSVDCRPLYLRDTLLDAGFEIDAERIVNAWELPVEVVLGRNG